MANCTDPYRPAPDRPAPDQPAPAKRNSIVWVLDVCVVMYPSIRYTRLTIQL